MVDSPDKVKRFSIKVRRLDYIETSIDDLHEKILSNLRTRRCVVRVKRCSDGKRNILGPRILPSLMQTRGFTIRIPRIDNLLHDELIKMSPTPSVANSMSVDESDTERD